MDLGPYNTMTAAYPAIVNIVLEEGTVQPVRDGLDTVELLGAHFTVEDAVHGGAPVLVGRKLGRKMQLIDGITNLAGMSAPDVFLAIAPFLGRFADDMNDVYFERVARRAGVREGKFFQGQYGPRLRGQLDLVVDELRRDPTSRRAVANIWDPETDFNPRWRDRPCTTQIQFLIRDGRLEIFVTMRSNDIWTGLAYDVAQFGQVQAAVASVLGIPWGRYHHHAVSLHAYSDDIPKLQAMAPEFNPRETSGPVWHGVRYQEMNTLQAGFRSLLLESRKALQTGEPIDFTPRNSVEQWYADEMSDALAKAVR